MNFYLVPIVKNKIDKITYRDPAFVNGRVGTGLNIPYTFFDFGSKIDSGVLVCEDTITDKDAYLINTTGALEQAKKDDFKSVLKKAGLDDVWTGDGADWREVVHRLLGLSQAMQSAEDDPKKPAGEDDPSKWLARFIHCGKVSFSPLNISAFIAEQQTAKKSNELIVKEFFKMGCSKELLKQATSQQFFALPASDVFTASDGTALTTYSANWSNRNGTFAIDTNRVGPSATSTECLAYWNADTFGNDQYAQGTITSLTSSGVWIGVSVRVSTSVNSGYGHYAAYASGQSDYLYKVVTGTFTTIDSIAGAYSVGNTIRLEVTGTTLTPIRNGSTHAMGTSTDSSLSSGAAGLSGYNYGTTNNLDDWSAGDLGVASGQPFIMRGINIPGMRVGR